MPWYTYIAAFFAGAFLANAVPHFVKGVTGEPFPSPFANPPGKGLSSPVVNVLWALANLVIGFFLGRVAHLTTAALPTLAIFFAGIAALSLQLAFHFGANHPIR